MPLWHGITIRHSVNFNNIVYVQKNYLWTNKFVKVLIDLFANVYHKITDWEMRNF